MPTIDLHCGDCVEVLRTLPPNSARTCVTSPPYFGLRDYGVDGQIGLEPTPDEYVARLVEVFREVRRVLSDDGTLWLNLGDSFGGRKQLLGVPWRVAFALQADGWYLRSDIIWHKPNPMPESVRDRPTKSHEYLFLFAKNDRYYYDAEAVKEPQSEAGIARAKYRRTGHAKDIYGDGKTNLRNPKTDEASRMKEIAGGGRNRRSVWTIPTRPYKGAHFATFPPALVEPCILAGTSEKGRCPHCSAPWARVVERDRRPTRPGVDTKVEGLGADVVGNRDPLRHVTATETVGWRPSCDCGKRDLILAEPVPDTVIDPFAGSGTTGRVAIDKGRNFVGVELNPDYLGLARERLGIPALDVAS